MSGAGSRSHVVARTARVDDLPAVLALVRQHRADAHAEDVLSGHTPAQRRCRRGSGGCSTTPGHRVVLAVLPAPTPATADGMETAVGLAVLGVDPLSLVLGNPQVTVDTFVVHREHRRRGRARRYWRPRPDTPGRPERTTSWRRSAVMRRNGSGSSPGWASRL